MPYPRHRPLKTIVIKGIAKVLSDKKKGCSQNSCQSAERMIRDEE
jgi:hypothetical protein